MEVLVLPDIHSRSFWKESVDKWTGQIIFLGDYIDPYSFEWPDELPNSVNSLLEILDFKDCNQERVTLLLGNHDFHYLFKGYNGSRLDSINWDTLHQIYNEDKEFFQIAKQIDDTLFTHAGVSKDWLKRHDLKLPETDADLYLNEIYKASPDIFWEISWERGGWDSTGSPIWHDVREFDVDETHFQAFGHTQLKDNPIKVDNWACIDVRRPFIIDTISHEISEFSKK